MIEYSTSSSEVLAQPKSSRGRVLLRMTASGPITVFTPASEEFVGDRKPPYVGGKLLVS